MKHIDRESVGKPSGLGRGVEVAMRRGGAVVLRMLQGGGEAEVGAQELAQSRPATDSSEAGLPLPPEPAA